MTIKIGSRGAKVKDLQNKLNKLGYGIDADGKFGPNTLRALKSFQRRIKITVDGIAGEKTMKIISSAIEALYKNKPSSKNFCFEDFISKADKYTKKNGIPHKYWGNIQTVMDRLERVRERIGDKPLMIRSGFRSVGHNMKVGGAKRSQHLYGKAVDVHVKGGSMSCYELAKTIYDDDNLRILFGGFGLGSDKNIHLDIRKKTNPLRPTFWWYKKRSWKEWSK